MDKDWKVKYIINDGEFLYNKKWNGKGYDEEGNIIYELINGTGKVKEYDYENKLIFEAEYLDGIKWNGKVKINFDNFKFEGEWLNWRNEWQR